jgi:hypothetical protein
MFHARSDNGDTDADLPGCRYFAVRTDESHLSGWVNEREFEWLCGIFHVEVPAPVTPDPAQQYTAEELLRQAIDALRDAGPVTRNLVAKRAESFLSDEQQDVKP